MGTRHDRRLLIGLVFAAAAVTAAGTPDAAGPQTSAAPADLVLVNGAVLTVDARDSIAQALAATNGKIVAVGTTDQIRRLAGPATQVIDLHGRTATPGLIDTHCHFSESADTLDLGDPDIQTMADVIAKVKAWAAKVPPGQWVRGGGWDEGKLVERRYITAADLDKAAPDNPVYLTHTTGHYGVANSMALRLAGITKDTPDPPGGTIDRDKAGNPTGVLKERATGLINAGRGGGGARGNVAAPAGSPAGRGSMRADVQRIIEGFNREGMTAVKDPGITAGKWDVYRQLLDDGKLTVRVFALWRGGATIQSVQQAMAEMRDKPKPPASLGDGRLYSGGVKLYIDGSGGGRTAWMYSDWNKDLKETDTGNTGYPANGPDYPEIYRQQVRLLTDAGIHIGTHAVGDKGIDWVVDAYADAIKASGKKGLRDAIIHANVPTDHALDVMAELQRDYDAGYPEAQSTFLWWIGDTYAGNFGPLRNPRLEPFATYVKRGIRWGGGSDYSVTPYAARFGLWASVARETFAGAYGKTPFGLAESVDIHTALKSYTIWAAHQLFAEDRIGSLEIGKDADIAVWNGDLYRVPTAAIKDLRCEITLVAGRIVYQAGAR